MTYKTLVKENIRVESGIAGCDFTHTIEYVGVEQAVKMATDMDEGRIHPDVYYTFPLHDILVDGDNIIGFVEKSTADLRDEYVESIRLYYMRAETIADEPVEMGYMDFYSIDVLGTAIREMENKWGQLDEHRTVAVYRQGKYHSVVHHNLDAPLGFTITEIESDIEKAQELGVYDLPF